MKRVVTFLFFVSCFFTGCKWYVDKAEDEARKFAETTGMKFINCTGQDSDGDGYVSCAFETASGEIKTYECNNDLAFGSGCREPKLRIW